MNDTRTFRTAMADAIHTVPILYEAEALDAVEEVFAMPEMQAIRGFFQWFAHRHGPDDPRALLLGDAQLPAAVVDWVMGS